MKFYSRSCNLKYCIVLQTTFFYHNSNSITAKSTRLEFRVEQDRPKDGLYRSGDLVPNIIGIQMFLLLMFYCHSNFAYFIFYEARKQFKFSGFFPSQNPALFQGCFFGINNGKKP